MARRMLFMPAECGGAAEKQHPAGSIRIPMGPFFLAGWIVTVSTLNGGSFLQALSAGGM
jgi:hypothetical protein